MWISDWGGQDVIMYDVRAPHTPQSTLCPIAYIEERKVKKYLATIIVFSCMDDPLPNI